MTDTYIHELPAAAGLAATDSLLVDQPDATRRVTVSGLRVALGLIVTVPFAFGDATPKTLLTLAARRRVLTVQVTVDTPFDGVGAALSVGTAAAPAALLPADAIDPASPGSYAANPVLSFAEATALTLSISPGAGAGTGAGVVILTIEP